MLLLVKSITAGWIIAAAGREESAPGGCFGAIKIWCQDDVIDVIDIIIFESISPESRSAFLSIYYKRGAVDRRTDCPFWVSLVIIG